MSSDLVSMSFSGKLLSFYMLQARPNGLTLGRPGSEDTPKAVQSTACADVPGSPKQRAEDGAWAEVSKS